jgi:arylsulfatase A-like enzyme
MDEGIGNVTDALAAKSMLSDTFIVFTTVCTSQ